MVRTTTAARGSIYSTPFTLSSQRSISSSIQNTDIRTIVEMAIVDFFHCENIPDAVAESSRFKRLVKVCHHVLGDDFVILNRKKMVGSYWISIMRISTI